MELSEDQALDLVAQLDVSVLGSGREQQEQKTRNVTATTRYITDFVQQQWDARLTVLLVLRFHRMLTYDVHHVDDHGDPVRYLMVEFASWLTDVPLAPATPSSKPSSPAITAVAVVWPEYTSAPRIRPSIGPTRRKMSKPGRHVLVAYERQPFMLIVAHSPIPRTMESSLRPGRSRHSRRHPPADDYTQEGGR